MSQDESGTVASPGTAPGSAGDRDDGGADRGTAGDPGGAGAVSADAADDGSARSAAFAEAAGQVVEDVYELRLTALFRQLVRTRGYKGAARVLGVDPRTVTASVREGMSRRVRNEVERMLVEKDGGARDELEEALGEMAEQVGGLKTQVAGLETELREGMEALGQTHAQGMRRLEQRLALGAVRGAGGSGLLHPAPVAVSESSRRFPDLVTVESADDDEKVFGNAWPLVSEWRELWDGHPARGRGLGWVSTRARILELEVAMLEEHGLTLPPETEPLRGLDRGAQLNWRLRALHGFHRRRARLELLVRLGGALSPRRWHRAVGTRLGPVLLRWRR